MKKIRNIITTINFKTLSIFLIIAISLSSVCIIDKKFMSNLVDSIKNTLQSTKPTEELFDDTSEVKLVSVLFGENSCIVTTTPLDYDLNLKNYQNFINNNGYITVLGVNDILYAPYSGIIKIDNLSDGIIQITLCHNEKFRTIFSGNFGMGIMSGELIKKGQPLAFINGDMQFYIEMNGEILDIFDNSGELLWKE